MLTYIQRWKVFTLYNVGDLRAQLPLLKGRWLVLTAGMYCFASVAIFHAASNLLKHPQQLNIAYEAAISVVFLFILVYNALAVGVLSSTSGKEEIQFLRTFPIELKEIVWLRIGTAFLRAELLTLAFVLPASLAVLTTSHNIFQAIYSIGLSLIVLPLFPSLVGGWINIRDRQPKLTIWLRIGLGIMSISIFTAPYYHSFPLWIQQFFFLLSLPVRFFLLEEPTVFMIWFYVVWFFMGSGILALIWHSARQTQVLPDRDSWLQRVLMRQAIQQCSYASPSPFVMLSFISIGRWNVGISVISMIFLSLIESQLISLNRFQFAHHSIPVQIIAIIYLLVSVGAAFLYSGNVFNTLLGDPNEHKSLQMYPISARMKAAAIFLPSILISAISIIIVTSAVHLTTGQSIIWLFAVFSLIIVSGGGTLIFLATLSRRNWLQPLIWIMAYGVYCIVSILIGIVALTLFHAFPLGGIIVLIVCGNGVMTWYLWRAIIPQFYLHFVEVL